jgi:hypothetical protein
MLRTVLLGLVVLGFSGGPRGAYAAEGQGTGKEAPRASGKNWETRIESALQKKVVVSLHETPLRQFVSWLGETTGELCLLDHRSLDDIGVAEEAPLTADLPWSAG